MKTFRWHEYRRFSAPMRRAGIPVPTLRTALNRGIVVKIKPVSRQGCLCCDAEIATLMSLNSFSAFARRMSILPKFV